MSTVLNIFAQDDELSFGTSLMQGHFTITKAIHRGGFGIAYLAKDLTGKKFVIKECFPDAYCKREGGKVVPLSSWAREDFQAIQRQFQAEARVLASFDHSNVIGIHNFFEENGTSYMVLEYVEGRDLMDIISTNNDLAPHQITAILIDVLEALSYIHEQGFLHGDLAPDNIMVTADLKPYLVDFGTARKLVPDDVMLMPVMRAVKDGYSPQEFYIAGGTVGSYSDLYSLAASFYQIITGKKPVGAQDRIKAISRQKPDPYEPLASLTTDYPDSFCAALDQALSAFPRRRPQTAEALLNAIAMERPEADLISFPHAHTHSPKGTGIYRSPAE